MFSSKCEPSPFTERIEDEPLLRGQGRYVADAPLAGAYAPSFVRSPHAFAGIFSIEIEAALRAPVVLAILTGADLTSNNQSTGREGRGRSLNYRRIATLMSAIAVAIPGTAGSHIETLATP
jgi:CO/xanthine dehydrogenase Mo-binding subunit